MMKNAVFSFCLLLASTMAVPAWAQAPETPKLRVSTLPIAGMTPIHAANKLGYFRQMGLEVNVEFAAGGAQTVPLLVQGSLQLANGPAVSIALANQQGFNLRLVPPALDDKRGSPGQTASLVKTDGPVKTVADLKGRRIAVNTINSVNWLYDRAFLRKHGLDPSQVTYVEVPFPSMIDALMRGSVDAINVPQPFHRIAVNTGQARVLGYPFVEVQPGLHIAAYAGNAPWLDANPNTVKAFVAAMRRAVEYLRANPNEAKNLIAEFTKSKRDLVEQVPVDDWSTELSAADVGATLKVMQQEGLLKKPMDPKSLIHDVGR
jgi:NitT/TauT family transport system substrate-binding protein